MEAGKHIKLSLGQEEGEFRLTVDGVAITINLTAPNQVLIEAQAEKTQAVSQTGPPPKAKKGKGAEGEAQVAAQIVADGKYYRQVSQEIYEGLGKLAKEINLSIQDLSLAEIKQTGMSSPGKRQDQAKNQVTEALLMTEQATLNVMDLVAQIQEDCQTVQAKLLDVTKSQDLNEKEEYQAGSDSEAAEAQTLWNQVLVRVEDLNRFLGPEVSEEGTAPASGPSFPLAEILQIILEFCNNETVKKHLKAVQAKADAIFRVEEVEEAVSLLGTDLPQEEGVYQLPLEPVLNLLKDHCEDDRVKELFTKMGTSAGKIFPVSTLPLEAQSLGEDFAEPLTLSQGNPEVESCWHELRQNLKLLAETQQVPASAPENASHRAAVASVQEVLSTVDRITGGLSNIVEALAIQELSGQRLIKVLNLLCNLQVQVLSLLVGTGHKLQEKLKDKDISHKESQVAREELDRLLHSVTPPGDEDASLVPEGQPLDQSAINDLLTSMGF